MRENMYLNHYRAIMNEQPSYEVIFYSVCAHRNMNEWRNACAGRTRLRIQNRRSIMRHFSDAMLTVAKIDGTNGYAARRRKNQHLLFVATSMSAARETTKRAHGKVK